MIPFNVITLGDFLPNEGMIQSLESFACFYNSVTAKHQKKSKLFVIDSGKHHSLITEKSSQLGIAEAVILVNSSQRTRIGEIYQGASLLLMPIKKTIGKIIPEALAYGIPVMCFDTPDMREYIDNTCGLLVRDSARISCVEDFGQYIGSFYFDPEARKLLKRAAVVRYENNFSWNKFDVLKKETSNS